MGQINFFKGILYQFYISIFSLIILGISLGFISRHSETFKSSDTYFSCSPGIVSIDQTVGSMVECGSPAKYTFSAGVTVSVFDSIIVSFDMPAGYNYSGNLEGGIELSTDPIVIRTPITSGSIAFEFDIQGGCGAIDGEMLEFDFSYILDKDLPTEQVINCSIGSEELTTDDIALSIASAGTPGRNTDESIIAV